MQTAAVIPARKARLQLLERPIPIPRENEILIHNHSVAINPIDWKILENGTTINSYPNVLGSDIAGVVVEVGRKVQYKVRKNDRVVGYAAVIISHNPDEGAFQQYSILRENAISKIPDNISFEQAAAIPMGLATAAAALFASLKVTLPKQANPQKDLHKGEGFLVYGASSSVGTYAVQLASRLGFTVFAVASANHEEHIKSLGASHFFDRSAYAMTKDLATAIHNVSNVPIRLGIDAISSGDTYEKSAAILSQNGNKSTLATTWPWPSDMKLPSNVASTVVYAPEIFFTGSPIGKWLFNEFLERQLLTGHIKSSPAIQLIPGGLSAIQNALDKSKAGVSGMKVVVPL